MAPSKINSKELLCFPEVIDIITSALNNTQDEYFVTEKEASDRTRTYLILESTRQDLAPIIVDFRHKTDALCMKEAMRYCLKAYEKYGKEPLLLIGCSEPLAQDVYDDTTHQGDVPGCFEHYSKGWASKCHILCPESINMCNVDATPLEPVVALGLIITQQNDAITNALYNQDPALMSLKKVLSRPVPTVNRAELIDVIDTHTKEFEQLSRLIKNNAAPSEVISRIKSSQRRIKALKRKYLDQADDTLLTPGQEFLSVAHHKHTREERETTASTIKEEEPPSPTLFSEEKAMQFVVNYKKDLKKKKIENELGSMSCRGKS